MAERPRQRRPFNLTQEPSVRLALAVRAAAPVPVRQVDRRTAITERLRSTDEEVLYRDGQVSGAGGGRALRALRLLLAAE